MMPDTTDTQDTARSECADCGTKPCEYAELEVWLRPYVCRHLTDDDRRMRDIVFQDNPRLSDDEIRQIEG